MKIMPLLQTYNYRQKNPFYSVSFNGFKCAEDNFEVKNLYNVPCPICSKPMLHTSEIEDFASEVEGKTGQKLTKALTQYQPYFHDRERLIVDAIKNEASICDDDLETIVYRLAQSHMQEKKEHQMLVLNKINATLASVEAGKKIEIQNFIDKYRKILENDEEFDKNAFLEELEKLSSFSNTYHKKTMRNAKKIPSDKEPITLLYKRLSYKKQKDIARELLLPALVTTEHIKAQSSGGENNTANYLAQCSDCNFTRGNREFKSWAATTPDFVKNMTRYIEVIAQKIRKGELSDKYDTYLQDITETIKEETGGKVTLVAPEIVNGNEPEEKEVIYGFIAKLNAYKGNLQKKLASTENTKLQMQKDEQFPFVVEYIQLSEEFAKKEEEEQEKSKEIQESQSKIEFFYQKREEIEKIAIQLKNQFLPAKNREHLENKLNSIKDSVASIDIKALKNIVATGEIELFAIQSEKNRLKLRIDELKTIIDFPEKIAQELEAIKHHHSTLKNQYARINNLYTKIQPESVYIKRIEEKEIRLSNLSKLNRQIITLGSKGAGIKKYDNLTALYQRAEEIEDLFQKNLAKKAKEEDKIIFEYAKSSIMAEIQDLAENDNSVKYQLNLRDIKQVTEELMSLHNDLEANRALQYEIEKREAEAQKYGTDSEIQARISATSKELELAKTRFDSINIDSKIAELEQEIAQIEEAVQELRKKDITKKEFARISGAFEDKL